MAAREVIRYKSSKMIRLVAPTDVINDDPLDNTDDGSTCTFRVFDPAKDEVLSAAEAIGQTVLSVTGATILLNDVVEVTQNDDTIHSAAVTAVDVSAGTVTIAAGLTVAAAAGNRIRVRLGNQITMNEYGTPALETRDWGFEGVLASDHAGLKIDLEIDIEMTFVGSVSGGLDYLEVLCAVIKVIKDCD